MISEKKGLVGVIGLGNMGSAMAANLVKAGFDVIGTDISPEACDKSAKAGVKVVSSAREVGEVCRHIILSLALQAALYEVCGTLAECCAKGSIVLETGTLPLVAKQKMLKMLEEKGITLLDSPLSGTGSQAKSGDLAVYASGDSKAIEELRPVISAFSRSCYDLGEFGNGIKTKLAANLLVAIHNVAAAEALLFGTRSGLDPAKLVQVLGDGAGSSRMFQVRAPMMVSRTWGEGGGSVAVLQKDIKLITEALQAVACPTPVFTACKPVYAAAEASGHLHHDTACVYEMLEKMTADMVAKK